MGARSFYRLWEKIILGFVILILGLIAYYAIHTKSVGDGMGTIEIDGKTFQVEIVRSKSEITKGLSGREQVRGDGMLFVLPERNIPSFWMKEMLFALDFIWIDGKTVVDITKNVPFPNPTTPLSQLLRYSPKQEVTHVLELPSGYTSQYGIDIGDAVYIHE